MDFFPLKLVDFSCNFFLLLAQLFLPHVQLLLPRIHFLQVLLNFLLLGRTLQFSLLKHSRLPTEPVLQLLKFLVLESQFVFDGQQSALPQFQFSQSLADDLIEVFGVLLLFVKGGFGFFVGTFLVSDEVFVVLALFGEVLNFLAEGIDSFEEKLAVVGRFFGVIFGADFVSELLFNCGFDLLNFVPDSFLDFNLHPDDFLFECKHFLLEFFLVVKQLFISFLEFLNFLGHLIDGVIFVSEQFLELR